MKLSDFIATTLTEIIDGVKRAQEHAKNNNAYINPPGLYTIPEGQIHRKDGSSMVIPTKIDFDDVITAGQDDKGQGGLGVFAGPVALGAKGEIRDYTENASRVQFHIVAQLPKQN